MAEKSIIGKSAYKDQILNSVRDAGLGKPRILFISGPAGIGKTSLIQSIDYPPGYQVIQTIIPEEESPSYSVIANLLRQTTIFKEGLNQNSHHWNNYIGFFLPEISRNENLNASFDLLVTMFREIISHITESEPLIWLIEDLQWADLASLEILSNLSLSLTGTSFLLMATYRNDQAAYEHTLRGVRTKLRRQQGFIEMELQPFTKNEAFEFIESTFQLKPSPSLVEVLYDQTGGLPLLLSEIMETLLKKELAVVIEGELWLKDPENMPVPENIRDLVSLKMDELSVSAKELAEIASSYGNEFPLIFLEKFTHNGNTIDELLSKGLIHENKPGFGSFRHTLYREVIRSEIAWSKRKAIYQKIATELENQKASPAILADFYFKAGQIERARPAYIELAKESCRIHAYQDAARYAEKALNEWPKGEDEQARLQVLEDFAHCSKISGNLTNAINALKEIADSELLKQNKPKLAFIWRDLASCYGLMGSWNHFQESKTNAIELFILSGNLPEAALDQMDLSEYFFKELKVSQALSLIDEALFNAEKASRTDIYTRCLALKGYLTAHQGKAQEGFRMATNAVNIALENNDTFVTAEAYRRLAGTLEYGSAFKESVKAYDLAFQFCSTHGLELQETQCLSCMAWVLLRVGDWRRCYELCRKVLEHPLSSEISKCTANTILALTRAYRGELKSAKKNLSEAARLADRERSSIHSLILGWPKAIIHIHEGDHSLAYQSFCEMMDNWSGSEDLHDSIAGFADAVSFFTMHEKVNELNKCVHALSEIANKTNNPEALGILSFSLGASLSLNEKYSMATDHFEKAVKILESVNIPLQTSIINYHLGLTYLHQNLILNAKDSFQSSYRDFKRLGIRHWCSLIEEKLQETAGKNKTKESATRSSPVESNLTPRQLEILALLSKGLSNKEIAVKTHLSTRTIDMHLRNIYDRLNCRTRTEAARIAFEKGFIPAGPSE